MRLRLGDRVSVTRDEKGLACFNTPGESLHMSSKLGDADPLHLHRIAKFLPISEEVLGRIQEMKAMAVERSLDRAGRSNHGGGRFFREVQRMAKGKFLNRGFALALSAALGLAALAAPATAQRRLQPGLYVGDYTCPQGVTALRLAIETSGGGRRIGVFDFGGNGDIPLGSYTVRVTRNRYGTYRLTPLRWIRRPAGYEMVGARLRRRGNELSGTIANALCGGIHLRGPAPAAD